MFDKSCVNYPWQKAPNATYVKHPQNMGHKFAMQVAMGNSYANENSKRWAFFSKWEINYELLFCDDIATGN